MPATDRYAAHLNRPAQRALQVNPEVAERFESLAELEAELTATAEGLNVRVAEALQDFQDEKGRRDYERMRHSEQGHAMPEGRVKELEAAVERARERHQNALERRTRTTAKRNVARAVLNRCARYLNQMARS